jgi:leucyl aminopeptidase (aminopeptidase T)
LQEQYAKIAENVVGRSLGVKRGEQVQISTWDHALDVAGEFHHAIRRRGAFPQIHVQLAGPYYRAIREFDVQTLKAGKDRLGRALAKAQDVFISFAGPRDPAVFKDLPYDKMRAAWDEKESKQVDQIAKRRRVRSTFLTFTQATPERASAYGLDFHAWQESALGAMATTPEEMAREAKPLQEALRKGKSGKLTFDDGSAIEFKLAGRRAILDDGVLRKQDVKRGDTFVHLPAGTVFFAPREGSFEGRASFDLPQASRGRWIRGIWADARRGKVQAFGAKELEDELRSSMDPKEFKMLEFSYISVGVNQNARPGFLDNQMASGVVGVHCGDNDTFGGRIKGTNTQFGGFSARATLVVDGKPLVDRGRLAA